MGLVGLMPLGALYPSKSGLMNKHIVKHIPKCVWFISSGSAFIIQIKNPKQSCDEAVLVLRHLLSFELKTQSSAGLCAILGHRNLNKAQISQDRHLTWKR